MAICPECGQPKSVSTWWIFETAVGYISLSTLFELGVVVTFILALFKGDFRSAFIEMCSFFVTPVFSGLFLFLLYCYWARYKCDAIQRAKSPDAALGWALFRTIAGVIFGASVAAILVSLNSKN